MLKLNARAFYAASVRLNHMSAGILLQETKDKLSSPSSFLTADTLRELDKLRVECTKLGLTVTVVCINELCSRLTQNSPMSFKDLGDALAEISRTLEREISSISVIVLDTFEKSMFEPVGPLFGVDVHQKFPALAYDIEEAGKCLALGRSTSSAFHSIRCLEGAIRAMSRCLGIPDPTKGSDRTWFKMLEAISRILIAMPRCTST